MEELNEPNPEEFFPLVYETCKRFMVHLEGPIKDSEEFGEGLLACVKASQTWDRKRPWSRYAITSIRNAISNYRRKKKLPFADVPSDMLEAAAKYEDTSDELDVLHEVLNKVLNRGDLQCTNPFELGIDDKNESDMIRLVALLHLGNFTMESAARSLGYSRQCLSKKIQRFRYCEKLERLINEGIIDAEK